MFRRAGNRLHPAFFGIAAVALYLILLLPILARHHFDLSVFIVAGDRFVDLAHLPVPIFVRTHSAGYDGQFYYAIAVHPFAVAPAIAGVTLDHPAWRIQRIVYPLLAHAAALAQPALIPVALLAVNLAAIFITALLIVTQCRQHRTSLIPALAILAWPGFFTTLTHDTTELTACCLLLGALLAYMRTSYLLFAILGATAALTRETSSLALAGLLAANLVSLRRHAVKTSGPPIMAASFALLVFIAWRLWLAHALPASHDTGPAPSNLTFPLMGLASRIAGCLREILAAHESALRRLLALYTLAVSITLVGYAVLMAISARRLWQRGGPYRALVMAWAAIMALMTMLSAHGPWIDATAILRAFSEAWVAGWLVISFDRKDLAPIYLLPLASIAVLNVWVCKITVG